MSRGEGWRPSPALALAVAALVAAVAGTAVASDPVATTAKLNKKDKKQVRKIANKQINKKLGQLPPGPAGPRGPAGPQGEQGEQGDIGPSDAFASSVEDEVELAEDPATTTVATTSGPAGSYVINAKLAINAPGDNVVDCTLDVTEFGGDTQLDSSSVQFETDHTLDTIALQAAESSNSSRIYAVRCSKREASSAVASERKLTAIRVGTVTEQP